MVKKISFRTVYELLGPTNRNERCTVISRYQGAGEDVLTIRYTGDGKLVRILTRWFRSNADVAS